MLCESKTFFIHHDQYYHIIIHNFAVVYTHIMYTIVNIKNRVHTIKYNRCSKQWLVQRATHVTHSTHTHIYIYKYYIILLRTEL